MANTSPPGAPLPDRPARSGLGCVVVLLVAAAANLAAWGLQNQLGAGWWWQLVPHRPKGIILHHSASPATAGGQAVDAALIDQVHARRGFGRAGGDRVYHIGYHYVILPDGTVETGRPEWLPGAHAEGHNNQLGICLIGNFSSSANPTGAHGNTEPTPAQRAALQKLLRRLARKYGFGPQHLHRHRDYAPTACPGDRFPFDQVRREAFPAASR